MLTYLSFFVLFSLLKALPQKLFHDAFSISKDIICKHDIYSIDAMYFCIGSQIYCFNFMNRIKITKGWFFNQPFDNIERKIEQELLIRYFFLRVSNNAAPAKVITAKPAIGAKSPVFAAFAFGVVDSCPVCVPST